MNKNVIPKEVQFVAISRLFLNETQKLLTPYIIKWEKKYDKDKTKLKELFSISKEELMIFLKDEKALCNQHYRMSIDRRSPGNFISEKNNKYLVGTVTKNGEILVLKELKFLYEAVAEYIFMNFGLE